MGNLLSNGNGGGAAAARGALNGVNYGRNPAWFGGQPLSNTGIIVMAAGPAWTIAMTALGLISVIVFFLYTTVGKPVMENVKAEAARLEAQLDRILDATDGDEFAYENTRKSMRIKDASDALKSVLLQLLSLIIYFLNGTWLLFWNVVAWFLVFVVLIILAWLAMGIETNVEAFINGVDIGWNISRTFMNVLAVFGNIGIEVSNSMILPGYNTGVHFAWDVLKILSRLAAPIITSGIMIGERTFVYPSTPNVGSTYDAVNGGGGGRRLISVRTASNASIYERYEIDGGVAEYPIVTVFFRGVGAVMTIFAALVEFYLTYTLLRLNILCELLASFPEVLGFILSLVSAPFCALEFSGCFFKQFVQLVADIFVDALNLLFIPFLSLIGVGKIPHGSFQCDRRPSTATDEDCANCYLLFPGWVGCEQITTGLINGGGGGGNNGRRLISCENRIERNREVWYESLDETKPTRTVTSDPQRGCPLTHRSFTPTGNAQNWLLFSHFGCYDICVNGTLAHACPDSEETHGTVWTTTHTPCGSDGARRLRVARATQQLNDDATTTSHRRDLASFRFSEYVGNVFKTSAKIVMTTSSANNPVYGSREGVVVENSDDDPEARRKRRLGREKFEPVARIELSRHADEGHFDCSRVELATSPQHDYFNTLCHLQTAALTMGKRYLDEDAAMRPPFTSTTTKSKSKSSNGGGGGGVKFRDNSAFRRGLAAAESMDRETGHKRKVTKEANRMAEPLFGVFDPSRRLARLRSSVHVMKAYSALTHSLVRGHAYTSLEEERITKEVKSETFNLEAKHREMLNTLHGGLHGGEELHTEAVMKRAGDEEERHRRLRRLQRRLVVQSETVRHVPNLVFVPLKSGVLNACPVGFVVCPDFKQCEPVGQCACPEIPAPESTGGQWLAYYSASAYHSRCYLQQATPSSIFGSISQCWNQIDRSDTNSPFASYTSMVNDPFSSAKNLKETILNGERTKYCPPMIRPIKWRFHSVKFDVKSYVRDVCGSALTLGECTCPNYKTGEFIWNFDWIQYVPVAEHDRLFNAVQVIRTFLGGIFRLFFNNTFNAAWQMLWGWIPKIPEFWVKLFDGSLERTEVLCAVAHLGAFIWFLLWFLVFYVIFTSYYGFVWAVAKVVIRLVAFIMSFCLGMNHRAVRTVRANQRKIKKHHLLLFLHTGAAYMERLERHRKKGGRTTTRVEEEDDSESASSSSSEPELPKTKKR